MDPVQLQRIRAISKSKKHQLLDNFFLYSMTVLTCIFCSSPFWLPSLFSGIKLYLFATLTKLSSVLFNSKFVFIVGNLIIILLIGESKFFTSTSISSASDVYYNEYLNRKRSTQTSSTLKEQKDSNATISFKENASMSCEGVKRVQLEVGGLEEEDEISMPAEELNKRADDFIAKVNRQRMQEERQLLC